MLIWPRHKVFLQLGMAMLLAVACGDSKGDGVDAAPLQDAGPLYTIVSQSLDSTVTCKANICKVDLVPGVAPTRKYARGRPSGAEELVFDGPDQETIYWADTTDVRRLDTGPYQDFSRPRGGRVWITNGTSLRQVDRQGQVWQEFDSPSPDADRSFVDQVGDTLVSVTRPTAVESEIWGKGPSGWNRIVGGGGSEEVVAINDEVALLLGYGYYYLWHVDDGVIDERGASDDFFNRAVRCGSTDFWVGGGTGAISYCTVSANCAWFAGYDFQSESVGCVDKALFTLQGDQLSKTDPDGTVTMVTVTMRHFWADLNIRWEVR